MSQTAFRAQRFCRGDVQKLSAVWETGLVETGNDDPAKLRAAGQGTSRWHRLGHSGHGTQQDMNN